MITHRNLHRWLRITVLLLVLLTFHKPSNAQEGGLRETFDNPDLPGWEHTPGVSVAQGVLHIEPGNFAFHGGDWSDFTLAVSTRLTGPGALLLNYRASESGIYHLIIDGNGLVLKREASSQGIDLIQVPYAIPMGEWFNLGVTAMGETHTVTINSQQVLTFSDSGSMIRAGGFGFEAVGEMASEVDHLVFTAGGETSLPSVGDSPVVAGTPAYEAPSWVNLGGPPGGLGYDIRMRPDNPDEMYVTDARAGIFKSVDGGMAWFATNGNLVFGSDAVAPIFCATIDPHNYNVVWIGTQITGHLYRSPDRGQTWETRDNGIIHDGRSLRGITIDPNNAEVVYVGLEVEAGQWQREHPEASAEMAGGEVYKSIDGGLTWTRIWQGPNIARYVWIDPRNSNRVYISTGIFDRIPANSDHVANDPGGVGILRSDDAGQTWTALDERNGLGGRIIPSLFMHPTNPDVLVAAVYGSLLPGLGTGEQNGSTSREMAVTPGNSR